MRGNLLGYTGSRREQRSIPACAGEPSRVYRFASRAEVYPRVCGGTFGDMAKAIWREGLSPRVRGNQQVRAGETGNGRSIPACAGEPNGFSVRGLSSAVYPRVCGGTCARESYRVLNGGLSPRVRGNRSVWVES